MAVIEIPRLTVTTDPLLNQARVTASCDVRLTDFEVHAAMLLGLRFTLECRVLNRDIQWVDTVLRYDPVELPRDGSSASAIQPITFERVSTMSDLHEHLFTRDELIAEFTLTNQETGTAQVNRTEVLTVALE